MKVGLFIPCYINAVYPEVGIASYKLLRHVGVDVDYPMDQTCCGQPMANAGFEDEAARLALRIRPLGQLRSLRKREPSPYLGEAGSRLYEQQEDL